MELFKGIVAAKGKLSKWIIANLGVSYANAQKIIRQKDVKLNCTRVSEDVAIESGDEVQVYYDSKMLVKKSIEYAVVYEDDNLLVVNKPAGIEVTGNNSLENELQKYYKSINAVNRIDRYTIGLVMFAKNKEFADEVKRATKEGCVLKEYRAWVYGKTPAHFSGAAFLFKDSKKSVSIISDNFKKGSVKIETQFDLIKFRDSKSLINVKIHSGKTHQIRAHLAHLGFALVGDGKYAMHKDFNSTSEKHHQLFAYKIAFNFQPDSKFGYLNNCKIEINNEKFM